MATFFKFDQFVEDLAKAVHNLDADTLKVYLSNAAPSASADAVKADLAEISTGNGYAGPQTLTGVDAEQTSGVLKLVADDVVITASGGTIGPFQYVVLYNDTPSSPVDPLIGAWSYGSAITLQAGETFTINFDATTGILTIT
jgi:hypothetical protein